LEAIAALMLAAQRRLEALLVEWDPRYATTMLTDWERLLGLPDMCTPTSGLSLIDRQRLAYQRLIEQGGQSRAYYLAIADQLGEPGCTIDEFTPLTCQDDCDDFLYSTADAFTWRVNIPHAAQNVYVMTCQDNCDDALQEYDASLIECPITERKPAHTKVIFAYAP
ncbi:MAG TPA: putative phage tail protein, partial [Terriglobales bacterium]|nr:putative phage tail protein [Terriglobales bacterium]